MRHRKVSAGEIRTTEIVNAESVVRLRFERAPLLQDRERRLAHVGMDVRGEDGGLEPARVRVERPFVEARASSNRRMSVRKSPYQLSAARVPRIELDGAAKLPLGLADGSNRA